MQDVHFIQKSLICIFHSFGLVWFGLVWFGLVWFGLVWFGLVWFVGPLSGHIGSRTVHGAESVCMKIKGYDPGLSLEAALKLVSGLELSDCIVGAVSGGTFICINISHT